MSPDNINHREELSEDCHLEAEKLLRDRNFGQNDRLAVELLKFAPVPEWFLSEWVPAERLLAGLRHEYLPVRWRIQFLERLAREPSLEARLQAAEHPDTLEGIISQLQPPTIFGYYGGGYDYRFEYRLYQLTIGTLRYNLWSY